MIDGLKMPITGRAQLRLRSHPLLKWKPHGLDRIGRERFVATWGTFHFKGDATRCKSMRGSFHRHHHRGENWTDFTREEFGDAVAAVCLALGLHPATLRLSNVEVGVNIVPPCPTSAVLRSVVLHRTQRPIPMVQGVGIVVPHTAYRFKIYDKAHHYGRPGQLLRFEVAVRKMRTLERFGVRTLADLLESKVWTAMRGYLLDRFSELLIVEPDIFTDGLKPSERKLLNRASEPAYWIGLERRARSNQRRTLAAIYSQHASTGLKATLHGSIAAKAEELNTSPSDAEAWTFSPMGEEGRVNTSESVGPTFSPLALRGANVRADVSKVDGSSEVVRVCPVCGRDITNQDARSQVCSERLYGKEGKRCRNTLSNRNLSLRRMNARSALLFDQQPYLRQSLPR